MANMLKTYSDATINNNDSSSQEDIQDNSVH